MVDLVDPAPPATVVNVSSSPFGNIPGWVWVAGGIAVIWILGKVTEDQDGDGLPDLLGNPASWDALKAKSRAVNSKITNDPLNSAAIETAYAAMNAEWDLMKPRADEIMGVEIINFVIPITVLLDSAEKIACAEAIVIMSSAEGLYRLWAQAAEWIETAQEWAKYVVDVGNGAWDALKNGALMIATQAATELIEVEQSINSLETFANSIWGNAAQNLADLVNSQSDPVNSGTSSSWAFNGWEQLALMEALTSHGALKIWLKRAKRRAWRVLNGYPEVRGTPRPIRQDGISGCSQLVDGLWVAPGPGSWESRKITQEDLNRFFTKLKAYELATGGVDTA